MSRKSPATNRQNRRAAAFVIAWKEGKRLKGVPRRIRRAVARERAKVLLRTNPPIPKTPEEASVAAD